MVRKLFQSKFFWPNLINFAKTIRENMVINTTSPNLHKLHIFSDFRATWRRLLMEFICQRKKDDSSFSKLLTFFLFHLNNLETFTSSLPCFKVQMEWNGEFISIHCKYMKKVISFYCILHTGPFWKKRCKNFLMINIVYF